MFLFIRGLFLIIGEHVYPSDFYFADTDMRQIKVKSTGFYIAILVLIIILTVVVYFLQRWWTVYLRESLLGKGCMDEDKSKDEYWRLFNTRKDFHDEVNKEEREQFLQ